jgi:hypothetical protein
LQITTTRHVVKSDQGGVVVAAVICCGIRGLGGDRGFKK